MKNWFNNSIALIVIALIVSSTNPNPTVPKYPISLIWHKLLVKFKDTDEKLRAHTG